MDVEKSVIARFKKEGKNFEILVDCDKAVALKGGDSVDLNDVVITKGIFSDVHKGTHASEKDFKNIFGTEDEGEIIKFIIKKGEIQLTTEYRNKLREEKRKKVIDLIHRNTVDSQTGFPHPIQRIDNAIKESKINLDEYKSAEEQVQEVIKKIRAIIPIKYEKREIQVKIPSQFIGKAYAKLKTYGSLLSERYDNDGSFVALLEIPSGIQEELFDQLNSLTHGQAEVQIIKIKE